MLIPEANIRDLPGRLGSRLSKKLDDIVPEEATHWCNVKTACVAGRPYEELTRYAADCDADLIVLGVRGRGLIETLMLGSTTDRVIRQASRPVLSVCQAVADGP
jgi:nucleotide-binding universal stress UspA family protein